MATDNVIDLDVGQGSAPPIEEPPRDPLADSIRIIQRWRKILAVRWLALIALLGAVSIWVYATIDPTPWRFGVACGFAVLVLCPTFWLYHARSD